VFHTQNTSREKRQTLDTVPRPKVKTTATDCVIPRVSYM